MTQDYLQEARTALEIQNYSLAINKYKSHILQNPNDSKTLNEYLEALNNTLSINKKQIKIAQGVFSKLSSKPKTLEQCLDELQKNPLNLNTLNELGKISRNNKQYQTSIYLFQKILTYTQEPLIEFELGRTYIQTEQFQEAENLLRKYEHNTSLPEDLKIKLPDLPTLLTNKKYEEADSSQDIATTESKKIATTKPSDLNQETISQAYEALKNPIQDPAKIQSLAIKAAETLSKQNNFTQAQKILNQAQELQKSSDIAKQIFKTQIQEKNYLIRNEQDPEKQKKLTKGKLETIVTQCTTLLQTSRDSEIHLTLADALCQQAELNPLQKDEEKYKKAITALQAESNPIPDNQMNKRSTILGKCFLGLNLPQTAEIFLKQITSHLKYTPETRKTYLETYHLLGQARESQSNTPGALEAYLKIIEKDINFKDTFEKVKTLEKKN